jgi:pSer/pThr/pTyr-binding forkhead associated (FHA) protein
VPARGQPDGLMADAFLKVLNGPQQGQNFPLARQGVLTIGRRKADVVVEDPLVSSTHAQVAHKKDGYVLMDLGSTNGTMVDGQLVREVALKPGGEFVVGNTRLALFVGEAEAAPAARPPAVELAWLLDEELAGDDAAATDLVDQDLRLPPSVAASLEVVAGVDAGRSWRCTRGTVTIGRRVGEVPLSDNEVSRRHAVVELFGRDMIFLRDLGSTNGTYHNGRRVHTVVLRPGDTIGVGRSVLRLQVGR